MDCNEASISIKPNNLPKIGINEVIKLSFDVSTSQGPGAPGIFFILKITVTNPDTGTVYYLDTNKKWANLFNYYYNEPYAPDNNSISVNLEIPSSPISGNLAIELILAGNTSIYGIATIGGLEAQNFKLEVVPSFKSFVTQGYISNNKDYVLDIDLPLGFNDASDGYFSYRGFLSNSAGLNLKNWYRYEYPTDIYRSLSELIVKQYSNSLNKNVINLDAAVMGMSTTNGRLSMAMRITATDTDPSQINVSNKKYIISNSTFDLPNNVIQATFLDINNENVSSTVVTTYDTNALTGQVTGFGRLRSTAYMTKEEAYAAPFTSNLIYTANPGVPAIGDVYYVNETLGTTFNGASLWWKVMDTDTAFSAYKISGSGVILETYG
jgi:hypothetical protein